MLERRNAFGEPVVDQPAFHVGENSPEFIAYRLMEQIAEIEGVSLQKDGPKPATRKWILDTYAESLDAVKANRRYAKSLA
jgi:hypothetical protein